MKKLQPFHLAIPVHDISVARSFYGQLLGFAEGRSDEHWVDYDFYGHQFVVHFKPMTEEEIQNKLHFNAVDEHAVPIPHFGVVLEWSEWEALAEKLREADIHFVIEPYIRFKGQVGEQATMFFLDPSGNALEFKAFKDMSQLFAK